MTLSLDEAFNRLVRSRRRFAQEQREQNRKKAPRNGFGWRGFQRKRFVIDFSMHIKRAIVVEGNSVSWIYQDRQALENERCKAVIRKPKAYKKHRNVTFDFTDLNPCQEFMLGATWYFITDNRWDKSPKDRLWLQFGRYKYVRDDCYSLMVRQSKKATRYALAKFQLDNPDVLPYYIWNYIVTLLTG